MFTRLSTFLEPTLTNTLVGTSLLLGGFYFIKKYSSGGVSKTNHLFKGKNVFVTGGNTGLGKSTCIEIAKSGANLIYIACRNEKLGLSAIEDIISHTSNKDIKIELIPTDLSDLSSIKDSVDVLLSKNVKFDILINNAGIMRLPYHRTKQGLELQFGVNHMGHFYLTTLLLRHNLINNGGRIVNLSSMAHKYSPDIDDDSLNPTEKDYDKMRQYSLSKFCNILFAQELQRRLIEEKKDITVVSCHPGVCRTELFRHENILVQGLSYLLYPIVWTITKSPLEGSQTTLHCATDPEVSKHGGKYFSDCKVKKTEKTKNLIEQGKKLWDFSETFIKKFEESQ